MAVVKVDNIKWFGCALNGSVALTTGTKIKFVPPAWLGARNLVDAYAECGTPSSSGDITISLYRNTGIAHDMLSTNMVIQANERSSNTGTNAVIDASYDDIMGGITEIDIDVDVAGTGALYVIVWLGFE